MEPIGELVTKLHTTLSTACDITVQQCVRINQMTQKTESIRQMHLSKLDQLNSASQLLKEGKTVDEILTIVGPPINVNEGQIDHCEYGDFAMPLQNALTSIQIYLMRLYAFPEARDSCEKTAEFLRQYYLIRVANEPEDEKPPKVPRTEIQPESTKGEKMALKVKYMTETMYSIRDHSQNVSAQLEKRMAMSNAILVNALEEAARLAELVR